MVQSKAQVKVMEMKISDLGLNDLLQLSSKSDPKNAKIYEDQESILESIKDFSINDFQQVIQWFSTSANKHAEIKASDIPLEEAFPSLSLEVKEK